MEDHRIVIVTLMLILLTFTVPGAYSLLEGSEDAEVEITAYGSISDPFTAKHFEEVYPQLHEEYIETEIVEYEYKHYVRNDIDRMAANAVECAREQGFGWTYLEEVLESQDNLSEERLSSMASAYVYLDKDKWQACQDEKEFIDDIEEDTEEANKLGAKGTPYFLIEDENLMGAQDYETFEDRIKSYEDDSENQGDAEEIIQEAIETDNVSVCEKLEEEELIDECREEVEEVDENEGESDSSAGSSSQDILGNPNAPSTIIHYNSLSNTYGKEYWEETFEEIEEEYLDEGRASYEYRHFALNDEDMLAGNAVECAGEQGEFYAFIEEIYDGGEAIETSYLEEIAHDELDLDENDWDTCMDHMRYESLINESTERAKDRGISGAPSFIVNGEIIQGNQPLEKFESSLQNNREEYEDDDENEKTDVVDLSIETGWNLVGLPGEVDEVVNTTCAIRFDDKATWSLEDGEYEDDFDTEPFKGFWMRSDEECDISLVVSSEENQRELLQGWNIISTKQRVELSELETNCEFKRGPSLYNNSKNTYIKSDILLPGRGYWIKTENTCRISSAQDALPPALPGESP